MIASLVALLDVIRPVDRPVPTLHSCALSPEYHQQCAQALAARERAREIIAMASDEKPRRPAHWAGAYRGGEAN